MSCDLYIPVGYKEYTIPNTPVCIYILFCFPVPFDQLVQFPVRPDQPTLLIHCLSLFV